MLPQRHNRVTPAVLALLAAWWALAALADEALLPAQLDAWERGELERVEAPELEGLAGEQASLLREYGSLRAERAGYRRGATQWGVTLHEMQDRSSAYGAFTLLRAGGEAVRLGEAGARLGNRLVFYQANYFVSVEGSVGVADLHGLARRLEARAGTQPSLPSLLAYLPREGFVAASDRYLLGPLALGQVAPLAAGDWVGFAYGAEVEAARYRVDGTDATLLLISYPTPQIAAERLRDLHRLFNLNGTGDPLRSLAYAKRSGSLVIFVAGLESGRAAARLLNQVRYEAALSWSEPSDPRPRPDWAKTVVNIFVGTGLLLLYALLCGLVFAAVRLLVKSWLPGKVFDRPEDTEIIQLDIGTRK